MRKTKLLAAVLALLLCMAGCAGREAPEVPDSSGASQPASKPEPEPSSSQVEVVVQPLSLDIRPLPAEQLLALSEDGFGWTGMGVPELRAEWVDENRLLFFSYNTDPVEEISDCRIFAYDIAAGQMTLLVDDSFPDLFPEVFFRDGTPYVTFVAKDAVTLKLDLGAGSYERMKGNVWDLSPQGLFLTMLWGKGDVTIRDGLDQERIRSTFRVEPEETFVSWSPDGELLAFQVQNTSRVSVYDTKGEKVREFAGQLWQWDWCQTPGYLTYAPPAGQQNHRMLLDLREGTETALPPGPEGSELLLREPEFSLLNSGGASILLDHRTGEQIPLGLGNLFFAVYHPDTGAIMAAERRQDQDGWEEWLEGYLIRPERRGA